MFRNVQCKQIQQFLVLGVWGPFLRKLARAATPFLIERRMLKQSWLYSLMCLVHLVKLLNEGSR